MRTTNIFLAVAVGFMWLVGCDDMTSVYEQYKGDSPIHYTAKVKDVLVRPGFNKAELSWPALKDPTIRKVAINWGGGTDSSIYDWDSSQPFVQEIDNLPEGSIIFNIVTIDKYGNTSLTTDATCFIYGDRFRSALEESSISGGFYDDYLIGMLTFYHSSSSYYKGMEVTYKDRNGADKTIFVTKSTHKLKIDDFGTSRTVKYHSVFNLEENALEEYVSGNREYEIPSAPLPEAEVLDKSKMAPLSFPDDTQIHASFRSLGVKACYDGLWPTSWTTDYNRPYHTIVNAPFPVLFAFDMGGDYILTKMRWYPRHIFCYGHPRIMEIYGATELNPDTSRRLYDENDVLDPYWTKLATLETFRPTGITVPSTESALTDEEKQILYDGHVLDLPSGLPICRYIRIRVLKTWGGGTAVHSTYVECNEITLEGVVL